MKPVPRTPVTTRDHLQPLLRHARRTLRFWPACVATLVIGLFATGAFLQFRPRQYRSDSVLYYREGMVWTSNEGSSTRRIGQRLRDVLLSRSQLTRIIQEMGLYPKLVRSGRVGEAVEEMLIATTFKVTDGDIFVISYTGDSPEQARDVTRRLTDVLIEENTRLRSGQAEVAQVFLESEKRRNEEELATKEAEYVAFLAKHPEFIPEVPVQGGVGQSLRASSRAAPSDADLETLLREEQRLRRQVAASSQGPGGKVDLETAPHPEEAEAKLKEAQRNLAEKRARFTDEHPDVRSAMAALRAAEAEYKRATAAASASTTAPQPDELEQRLVQVRQDIEAHRQRQAAAATPGAPGAAPRRAVALEAEGARLARQVAESRERLQQLDTRQFVASMTVSTLNSGQAAQLVVIDPAFLPAKPVGMSNTRVLLLGVALSLVSGFGLAVFLGLLDDRLHERDDVEHLAIAPILTEIPALRTTATTKGAAPPRRGPLARRASTPSAVEVTRPRGKTTEPETGAARPGAPATQTALALLGAPAQGQTPDASTPTNDALAIDAPVPGVGRGQQAPPLVRATRVRARPAEDAPVVMLRDADSPAAAGFRVLRHRLEERSVEGAILVTSPRGGEGKTFCAINMALALGEAWQSRVLLLEADFRNPSLARLLGFQPPACIARQLERDLVPGAHTWDVAEVLVPWLHAAVVNPDNSYSPELDGPSLRVCVEDSLRAGYDYIVIDTPPVLGTADVNLVEASVGGIVMVLRAGHSRARDFRAAVEQIGTTKLLGVIWLAG
jgi:Mrp family chromosome partitioning ATPase/uncharacterized protein involved in exopolysaccharide biosynthesis